MSARCSDVLSASEIKLLRIVERVEGFLLQRFDEGGDFAGALQFDTLDEAMHHVYSTYPKISDWRFCPDELTVPTTSREER